MSAIKLKNTLLIVLGTIIVAFGLVHFNMQNKLAEGGLTGISLIFYFNFGISTAVSYFLMNIPLFILGCVFLGRKSMTYTLIGIISMSLWLRFFETFHFDIPLHDDLMLAALYAGVFSGVGLGLVFKYGGTTGGTDIIAKLGSKFFGWKKGATLFAIDIGVLLLSLLTYQSYREIMYTLVAVFIATRIIDMMCEGQYDSRGVMIISNSPLEIADRISTETGRGVTFLRGHGYYSKEDRDIVHCIVAKSQLPVVKQVINEVDPHAFVTVSVVQDVLGEGFTFDANKVPFERD